MKRGQVLYLVIRGLVKEFEEIAEIPRTQRYLGRPALKVIWRQERYIVTDIVKGMWQIP